MSAACIPLVDAAWRITNHPGTLTKEWHQQVLESGVDPVGYLELVAVVAMANALEHFCSATGSHPPALPEASTTSPQRLPSTAAVSNHWVPTTQSELPNVRKALSASPAELDVQALLLDALYVPGGALAIELHERAWSLERTQLELVAARVSTLNECFY